MQPKILVSMLLLAFSTLATTISISKDSLWVSNSDLFSKDDAVVFSNHGSSAVVLDSAYFEFDVLDTAGMYYIFESNKLHMVLRETHKSTEVSSSHTEYQLTHLGNKTFRLLPGTIKTLSMGAGEDSVVLSRLQFGSCFMCSSLPRFPKYLRGKWRLFLSNGEEVALTIYSNDLRGYDPLRGITRSKDSLFLYNNPLMSRTDQIQFVNYNQKTTYMDSGVITFDEFDTTGSGTTGLEKLTAQWMEHATPVGVTYFNLQKIDAKKYRMIQRPSAASNPVPLEFDEPGETLYITKMEIGTCLDCSGLPVWYPAQIKGTMELHFTSGQTIRIRLITYRTPKIEPGLPCTDYACDSTVVRKILDENGMPDVPVGSFSYVTAGRISRLQFSYDINAAVALPKQLVTLSPEIGRLSGLEQLELAGNRLEVLPASIGRLSKLKMLALNNNLLQMFHDSIIYCTNLEYLSADRNTLTKLPENIGQLGKLLSISLTNNKLATLPAGIEKLEKLRCLFIAGNSICHLLPEAVSWMKNVQKISLCSRWEPVWPDSQTCNVAVAEAPAKPATSSYINTALHDGNLLTIASNTLIRSVRLFDASGRLVAKTAPGLTNHSSATITTASLQSGIYYLMVTTENRAETRRIVLQH